MTKIRLILSFFLMGVALAVQAQSNLEAAFQSACRLNDKQEYLKAAESFIGVQHLALLSSDYDLLMKSITAEGECYYMLNMVSDLGRTLDKAREAYRQHHASVDGTSRLLWREAVCKLEGSYFYCMTDAEDGAFAKAEKAYERCLAIVDSLVMFTEIDDEEMGIVVHRELLSLYYKQHLYDKALTEAEKVYFFYRDIGYESGSVASEVQHSNSRYVDANVSYAMVLARLSRFDEAFAVLSELPPACGELPPVIRTKGKILMMQYDFDGTDQKAEAAALYGKYIHQQKKEIAGRLENMSDIQREQYWLNLHDFLFDCCRLGDFAPDMLYDLALFSKGYLLEYKNRKAKIHTWQEIRNSLEDNSCAIEFIQYNGKNEKKYIAALVVTKRSPRPTFVKIAAVDSLKDLMLNGRIRLGKALASPYGADKNAIYNDRLLPQMIWTDRLLEATGGARKLYFSADGLLQQLAIEYMLPDSVYSCRRLTSTRMLVEKNHRTDVRSVLLFGDIDYAARQRFLEEGNDEQAYTFFKPYSSSLVDLPGTRSEIDSIAEIRQNASDRILTGAQATDSAFVRMANHYPLVHIATHGYFVGSLEEGTDMKPLLNDHALSKSGLAFAGARYALRDTSRNGAFSDGLLSAKELSQIPLDSVSLIVLSACQTGLGYITSDGVYGIQRALKQAGVKAMIVSLWSVDDTATSILMGNFYRNLQEGDSADVYGAFIKARHQLMTEEVTNVFNAGSLSSKKINKYAAPQYANAFILIDVQ